MKKIVVESIYEYRNFNSSDKLNELNLKNLMQTVKGAVTGQSQKASLVNFFNNIKGKDDVPDETVTKAFDNVYSYSYGKYPKLKEAAVKWTPAQKFQLMQKSKAAMDKNPKLDTPVMIIKDGKVLSGAITTGQASGTHGNAAAPTGPAAKTAQPAKPAQPAQPAQKAQTVQPVAA